MRRSSAAVSRCSLDQVAEHVEPAPPGRRRSSVSGAGVKSRPAAAGHVAQERAPEAVVLEDPVPGGAADGAGRAAVEERLAARRRSTIAVVDLVAAHRLARAPSPRGPAERLRRAANVTAAGSSPSPATVAGAGSRRRRRSSGRASGSRRRCRAPGGRRGRARRDRVGEAGARAASARSPTVARVPGSTTRSASSSSAGRGRAAGRRRPARRPARRGR